MTKSKPQTIRGGRIYTTGEVAKLFKVAPRTVSKWCDSGRLKHYKIPGSQDRRIVHANLKAFAAKHGMTEHFDAELARGSDVVRVLLVGVDSEAFAEADGVEFERAGTAFGAGVAWAETRPQVVVVDLPALGRIDALTVVATLKGTGTVVLALDSAGELSVLEGPPLDDQFDRSPFARTEWVRDVAEGIRNAS